MNGGLKTVKSKEYLPSDNISYTPPSTNVQTQELDWKNILIQNPYKFLEAPLDVKRNKSLHLEVLKNNPSFFECISEIYKKDMEFNLETLKLYPFYFESICVNWSTNIDFLIKAFSLETTEFWPDELIKMYKGNEKFISELTKYDLNIEQVLFITTQLFKPEKYISPKETFSALKCLILKMLKNTNIDSRLVSLNVNIQERIAFNIAISPPQLFFDIEYMTSAIEKCPELLNEIIHFLPNDKKYKHFCQDWKFIEKASTINPIVLALVDKSIKDRLTFIFSIQKKMSEFNKQIFLKALEEHDKILYHELIEKIINEKE